MIWLIILPLLAAMKVTVQGFVSRKKCVSVGDSFLLNAMIFAASVLVLFPLKFAGWPAAKILLPALFFGVCSTAFQCLYLAAFKAGPVGMTTVINNFNLLLPILYSACVFGETITRRRLGGVLLMAVSLILLPRQSKGKFHWKWLLLSLAALVAAGSNNTILLIVSRSNFNKYESDMVVVTGFAVAAVLSSLISLLFRKSISLKPDLPSVGGIAVCGVAIGLHNCLTIVSLKALPAIILYPIVNILTILLILLSDFVIYKEKLSKRQIVGIVLAAGAIILLN